MPAALTFPIGSKFYDWKYESEPEPFMNGRKIYHARGKVLGGSSSINGMIFQRGNPLDYERWAADPGMETWDYAHCLPYFKKMENCLAADGADQFRGHSGPLELERGPATNPLFGAFFEAVQAGRLPDHRRRQRVPAGGLRQVRPQRPPRPPAQRGPRLPPPGDAPQEPHGHDACAGASSAVRRHAGDRRRVQHPPRAARSRSPPARSSCAVARSTRRSCCSSAESATPSRPRRARHPGRARPARRRPAHAGPPRGLRAVLVQATGVVAAAVEDVATAVHRRRVVVPAQGPWRVEPLRGRRVRAQQRRGRLPQPDVPLPADRGALRRFVAGRRARLPGAHRADVQQLARLGADHLDRPEGQAGAALQLHLDARGSPRVGRGDPHRPAHLEPAGDGAVQRWRGLTRARASRPTSRSSTGCAPTARPRCIRRARAAWVEPTTTASSTR